MFVKVNLNGNNRKFKLKDTSSLEDLKKELTRCYGSIANEVTISYTDSEKEVISISTQDDWEICVEEFDRNCKDKTIKTISISLNSDKFFVAAPSNDVSVQNIQETAIEIQEEPKIERALSTPTEGKVIEEKITANRNEMIEEKVTPVEPTKVDQPQESMYSSNNQHLKNLVEQVNSTLGNLLGFQVDLAEARVEQDKPEQSIFEDQASINSTLTHDMRDEIKSLIDERISQVLKNSKTEDKPTEQKPAVNFTHKGITCDGCKNGIHNCARYKSLIKNDYDLCEACERKGIHPGPMVRFSAPANIHHWKMNRVFNEISHHFTEETPAQTPNPEVSGHNPFGRGQGRGGFPGSWTRCHQGQQEQQQVPHPNPFASLQNMGRFDLGQISAAIPSLIESFTKNFQKKTHQPTETHAPPTHANRNQEIIREVQQVITGISADMITEIMQTQKFTTSQQVVDFLLN